MTTLRREPITKQNISQALDIAQAAFQKPRDKELLAIDFYAYARGKRSAVDPVSGEPSTVLEYSLFFDGAVPVATCGLYRQEADMKSLWFCWLAVAPERQGQKLGHAILNHLRSYAKEHSYTTLKCVTSVDQENERVRKFYRAQGFEQGNIVSYRDESLVQFSAAL